MGLPGSPGVSGLDGVAGQKVRNQNVHTLLFIVTKLTVFTARRVTKDKQAATVWTEPRV